MHISEELQKGVKALMAITVRLNKKQTTNPKTNGMQMCNSKLHHSKQDKSQWIHGMQACKLHNLQRPDTTSYFVFVVNAIK